MTFYLIIITRQFEIVYNHDFLISLNGMSQRRRFVSCSYNSDIFIS